jgi:hypothetical protein
MMLSVKHSWWLQNTTTPYYDLTEHWAGADSSKGDKYGVNATNDFDPNDRMLQRRLSDNTIRETDIPIYTKLTPPNFIDNDIVASTVPLNKITTLSARYHRIDKLLFTPSIDTPNLEWILLRGNQMNIPELDFTNCVNIKGIDTSINQLLSIKLPPRSEDASNYFQYAYIGHFYGIRNVPTIENPPEVVDAIVERAYFSNVSLTAPYNTGSRYKDIITDPCNAHLYHGPNKTLPYHVILARDRNWRVNHLSVESFDLNLTSGAQTYPFDLYSSGTHHEIDVQLPDNPSWLSLDKNYFYGDTQNIQTLNITVDVNNTGAPRSTTIRFRKLKTYDNLFEMHQAAEVVITQSA